MSWNEREILTARRTVVQTAQAMLRGTLSYIEGARTIVATWRIAKLDERDPDFLPFVGIDSETEALPLGDMRAHWNVTALAALQSKIDRSEAWAKEFGAPYCQNLVNRFSDGWPTRGR